MTENVIPFRLSPPDDHVMTPDAEEPRSEYRVSARRASDFASLSLTFLGTERDRAANTMRTLYEQGYDVRVEHYEIRTLAVWKHQTEGE